jgi:hypothetical protein
MSEKLGFTDWQIVPFGPEVFKSHVPFGIKDSKGREIGCLLYINTAHAVYENGKKLDTTVIAGHIQSSRNGSKFGALNTSYNIYPTVDAAKQDLMRKAIKSLRKVEKRAAQFGGVYVP